MLEEFTEVLQFNYKQTASNQEQFPMATDWPMYFRLEDLGLIHVTTIRDDGNLVGYMSFMTTPSHNFMDIQSAYPDKYVVMKEYWGQGLGKKLVLASEKWAIELGCKRMFGGVRINQGPAPIKMYEDLGFKQIEITLEKVLDV